MSTRGHPQSPNDAPFSHLTPFHTSLPESVTRQIYHLHLILRPRPTVLPLSRDKRREDGVAASTRPPTASTATRATSIEVDGIGGGSRGSRGSGDGKVVGTVVIVRSGSGSLPLVKAE